MNKLLLLGIDIDSTKILSYQLGKENISHEVLIVGRQSALTKLKLRTKKLGKITVFFQLCTMIAHALMFRLFKGAKGCDAILRQADLKNEFYPGVKVHRLNHLVNSEEVKAFLQKHNPEKVLLCGTDIVKKHILKSITGIFINIHSGITPEYRGVHGGFWALVNNDLETCGVTLHFVDEGVDTGSIIGQALVQVKSGENNLQMLALKQLIAALPVLVHFLKTGEKGKIISKNRFSKQWYFPDLLNYIKLVITRRITY